jgi:hypothetical protein
VTDVSRCATAALREASSVRALSSCRYEQKVAGTEKYGMGLELLDLLEVVRQVEDARCLWAKGSVMRNSLHLAVVDFFLFNSQAIAM